MKNWFNVEVCFLYERERNFDIDEQIGKALGFVECDIDEREPYRLTAVFSSDIGPEEMRGRISKLFDEDLGIHYVDVINWTDIAYAPTRFTVRYGGVCQNYKTIVTYEEVNDHE